MGYSILRWIVTTLVLGSILPTLAFAANANNFDLFCANGAVAQTRSDGKLELVNQGKLELEKDRAQEILRAAKESGAKEDIQISRWQYLHLLRKIRATQKLRNHCTGATR